MTESMKTKMTERAKSVNVKFECFANPVAAIFGKIKEKKDALSAMESPDPVHIFITLGEDRDSISSSLIKKPDPNVKLHEDLLPRSGMTERIESLTSAAAVAASSDEEDASISGTFVRGLVESGNLDEFARVYSKYLNQEESHELFDSIKSGLDKFHAEPAAIKPTRSSRRKNPSPAKRESSPETPTRKSRKHPSPTSPSKPRRSSRTSSPVKKGGKITRKN
jgi:hypothetical protein